MDCLKNIVGVTRSEHAAIIGGLTDPQKAALALSTSGLFMDELEGGVHFKAIKYADLTKTFYDLTLGARDNAIRQLEDDLIIALNSRHTKSKKNFAGQIGQMSYANTLAVNGNYQGLRIRPLDYMQAVISLSRFHLIVNTNAAFNVYLYSAYYGAEETKELIATFPVNATANTFATVDTLQSGRPYKLPLTEGGNTLEYWLVYDRNEAGGASPKDAKIECSTCLKKASGLGSFVDVKGVGFSSLTELKDATADNYNHGFTLDVEIKCDSVELFCSEYKENDAISVTMAHAVRWKAMERVNAWVLKSPDVNRYTMMDRNFLAGYQQKFKNEYDARIEYLAETINVTDSNCYICREKPNQPFFSGIYS